MPGAAANFCGDAFAGAARAADFAARAGWAAGVIFRGRPRAGGAFELFVQPFRDGQSVAGLSATNFPTTNYDTGAGSHLCGHGELARQQHQRPGHYQFHGQHGFGVAGRTGDGTFAAQTTFPTGVGPVCDHDRNFPIGERQSEYRSGGGESDGQYHFDFAGQWRRNVSGEIGYSRGHGADQRDREKSARPERLWGIWI